MATTMPRISPPLKWHGGKHHIAAKIIALMPPHTHYVEPYFGGGAVLLAKTPDGVSELVNDRNGPLTAFWRVLKDERMFAKLQRRLEATPFSQTEWIESAEPCADPVESAARFFSRCRQSLAGRMKDFAPSSRTRTRRGMNEQVSAWLNAIEGLPMVHSRLKLVRIENRDALDVIRQQDGTGTLFYLDPPYMEKTRTAPDVYAFEMTDRDHERLLEVALNCFGKVMLSGYRSPLYDSRLSEWNRHDFNVPNSAAGGDRKRRMIESLWCNF